MSKEKMTQSEIGGYISTLLRKHFGKGPTSVFVTLKSPYIVIHFRGFIAPMETILLKQNEWKRVLETRDLLINELKDDLIKDLRRIAGVDIQELYADWDLNLETGLLIGVMNEEAVEEDFKWPQQIDKPAFERQVIDASERAEKKPSTIKSFWLNDRTILVKKSEILVGIENALIDEGYTDILKLAKRPLERRLLLEAQLEKELGRQITEIFLDWNFSEDIGYVVFLLQPLNRINN